MFIGVRFAKTQRLREEATFDAAAELLEALLCVPRLGAPLARCLPRAEDGAFQLSDSLTPRVAGWNWECSHQRSKHGLQLSFDFCHGSRIFAEMSAKAGAMSLQNTHQVSRPCRFCQSNGAGVRDVICCRPVWHCSDAESGSGVGSSAARFPDFHARQSLRAACSLDVTAARTSQGPSIPAGESRRGLKILTTHKSHGDLH